MLRKILQVMSFRYAKWFADLMRGINVVTIILRIAISPQFLYKCSENVTIANVAFDVGAYITLAASALPWYDILPWTKQDMWGFYPHVYIYSALLFLTVGYVVLMVLRWYVGLGSLSSCSGCPTVSQTNFTQKDVECTANSADFFYNGLNYCTDVFSTLCYPKPSASTSNLKGLDSSVAHCPLLGCNVQLLPLQFVSYWWTVATFGVNIILCVLGFQLTDKLKDKPNAPPAPERNTENQPIPSAPPAPAPAPAPAPVPAPATQKNVDEEDLPSAVSRLQLFHRLPPEGTRLQLPRRRVIKVRPLPV